jgi:hypothetical protein
MVLPPAALLQLRRGPTPAGAGTAGLASPRPGATALVAVVVVAPLLRVVVLVERREEGAEKREVVVLSTELLR